MLQFPQCLYRYLLDLPRARSQTGLKDLASIEPSVAKSFKEMLGRGLAELGLEHLVFMVEEDFFGERRTVPLRPGGEQEPVTDANKARARPPSPNSTIGRPGGPHVPRTRAQS
eukprot:tig00020877_g14697.t1